MSSQPRSPQQIQFGPFDLDQTAGELRKHGIRLKVRGQPVAILTMLVDRPGDVVNREAIQRTLWSGTAFGDFEHGLNAAVNKLRQALGDTAENPRYIETVPGRGYRFIAPIQTRSHKALLDMPAPEVVASEPITKPRSRWRWQWTVAAIAAGIVAGTLVWWQSQRGQDPEPLRFQISGPEGRDIVHAAVSPNGRQVVMSVPGAPGRIHLWVRSLDALEARQLPGVDTGIGTLFWSPDGRFVGYNEGFELKKVAVSGAAPQTLAPVETVFRGATWNPGGVILWGGAGRPIQRVAASGGERTFVTGEDGQGRVGSNVFPSFLPDGQHFLYVHSTTLGTGELLIGSLEAARGKRHTESLAQVYTTESPLLLCAEYVAPLKSGPGRILYMQGNALMSQPFDAERLKLAGDKEQLADQVSEFSASRDTLIYKSTRVRTTQLTWVNHQGNTMGTAGQPGQYLSLALAPNGTQAAAVKPGDSGHEIWLLDLERGVTERFASGTQVGMTPVWSADGEWIYFSLLKTGSVYRKAVRGGSKEELLFERNGTIVAPTSISRDGRFLLLDTGRFNTGVAELRGGVASTPPWQELMADKFFQIASKFSPNGQWIAYEANELGRSEVYVRSFSPGSGGKPSSVGTRFLISRGGGRSPSWRNDGRELSYIAPGGAVMAVQVVENPKPSFSEPKVLMQPPSSATLVAISPDHKRVLAALPEGQDLPASLTVVRNWQTR